MKFQRLIILVILIVIILSLVNIIYTNFDYSNLFQENYKEFFSFENSEKINDIYDKNQNIDF